MEKKRFFRILSFVLFGLGSFFILSSEVGVTGAFIGVSVDSSVASFIGFILLMSCVALFMAGASDKGDLEEKVRRGEAILPMEQFMEQPGVTGLDAVLRPQIIGLFEEAGRKEKSYNIVPLEGYSKLEPIGEKMIDGKTFNLYQATPEGGGEPVEVGVRVLDTRTLHVQDMDIMVPTRVDVYKNNSREEVDIDWEEELRKNDDVVNYFHTSIRELLEGEPKKRKRD